MKTNKVNEVLQFPDGQAFEEKLTVILADENAGVNAVIALLDVDHFMHVNDDFGHDAGDRVLIELGQYLQKGVEGQGEIYRIQGDEFGILFNADLEKEDAFLLMEQLRRGLDIKLPDGEQVTISVGIAAAFEDASRYQELVRKAESAMFRVKYAGRNKVALCREEKMIPKTSHYTSDQLKRLTKLSKREGIGEAILLREALDMLLKRYDV
ncbi:MAG: diguanylate cyclase [Clostridia bacterium]|nr:diguanylate cyclase [Clostridia bacterium]